MEQGVITTAASMNLIIIIAVAMLASLLGVALYRIALGASAERRDSKSLIEPLDVLAFNNLIDPAEEQFLREALEGPTFRRIQRLRLQAASQYVMCANRNAGCLIRFGKTFSPQVDAERSRQIQNLVNAAVHLRLLSILVLCLLWVKIAFPGLRLSLKEISALHERLVHQQAAFARRKSGDHVLEPSLDF